MSVNAQGSSILSSIVSILGALIGLVVVGFLVLILLFTIVCGGIGTSTIIVPIGVAVIVVLAKAVGAVRRWAAHKRDGGDGPAMSLRSSYGESVSTGVSDGKGIVKVTSFTDTMSIVDYVRSARGAGFADEAIKSALRAAGWKQEAIEFAYRIV